MTLAQIAAAPSSASDHHVHHRERAGLAPSLYSRQFPNVLKRWEIRDHHVLVLCRTRVVRRVQQLAHRSTIMGLLW